MMSAAMSAVMIMVARVMVVAATGRAIVVGADRVREPAAGE